MRGEGPDADEHPAGRLREGRPRAVTDPRGQNRSKLASPRLRARCDRLGAAPSGRQVTAIYPAPAPCPGRIRRPTIGRQGRLRARLPERPCAGLAGARGRRGRGTLKKSDPSGGAGRSKKVGGARPVRDSDCARFRFRLRTIWARKRPMCVCTRGHPHPEAPHPPRTPQGRRSS